MFQLPGGWEIILIIVIIVFLLAGNKAKDTMKNMGKGIYKAKKEMDDLKDITKKID